MKTVLLSLFVLGTLVHLASCTVGKWIRRIDESYAHSYSIYRNSLYKGSHVDVQILCSVPADQRGGLLKVHWIFQQLECMDELYATDNIRTKDNFLAKLSNDMLRNNTHLPGSGHNIAPRAAVPRKGSPDNGNNSAPATNAERNPPSPALEGAPGQSDPPNPALEGAPGQSAPPRPTHPHTTSETVASSVIKFQISGSEAYTCEHGSLFHLVDESSLPHYIGYFNPELPADNPQRFTWKSQPSDWKTVSQTSTHTVTAWEDGLYHFMINIAPVPEGMPFNATVSVKMMGDNSYLPAIQWPLLPTRGVLAFLYLAVGTCWVMVWARSHQHSLKIHIVIGAVAVAAALANTLSFVELSSMNSTGRGLLGVKWLSIFLSVLQNCLTHLVLMIVSTGYGITRPELQRNLVATAMCLASFTAIGNFLSEVVLDEDLRIKYSWPDIALGVNIGYGLMVLVLGGWTMIYSVLTFVHLGRRNHSSKKVRSFTIFTAAAIVVFIVNLALLFVAVGLTQKCSKDWHLEWLFQTFGSMTSLLLLLVLMWLWRPVDQAQSYAFTPLNTDEQGLIENDTDDDDVEMTVYDKAQQENGRLVLET